MLKTIREKIIENTKMLILHKPNNSWMLANMDSIVAPKGDVFLILLTMRNENITIRVTLNTGKTIEGKLDFIEEYNPEIQVANNKISFSEIRGVQIVKPLQG